MPGAAGRAAGLEGAHVSEGWGATQGGGVPGTALPISRSQSEIAEVPRTPGSPVSPLCMLSCTQSGRLTSLMPRLAAWLCQTSRASEAFSASARSIAAFDTLHSRIDAELDLRTIYDGLLVQATHQSVAPTQLPHVQA